MTTKPSAVAIARPAASPALPTRSSPSGPAVTPPKDQAALKCVYLALMALDPIGKGRARWQQALNAFDIRFDGRLSAAGNEDHDAAHR